MLYVRVRTARTLQLGAASHVCELQLLLEPMAALMVGVGTRGWGRVGWEKGDAYLRLWWGYSGE